MDYVTREAVDGVPATVTWSFPNGHLASVVVEREGPATSPGDFDQAFEELQRTHGVPQASLQREQADIDRDAVITALAVIGVVVLVGILVVVAAKGGGGGGGGAMHLGAAGGAHAASAIGAAAPVGVVHPAHAALWVDFAALRVTADALEIGALAAAPSGPIPEGAPLAPTGGWMAEWRTPDTQILLLGVDLGAPNGRLIESYRSIELNPGLSRN